MRASRLLSLLLLLQARGRMTAAELAHTLEVSVRTIYRDLEALDAAGVPICTERGPGGGVWLLEGYRTRLTGLTHEEAEALFLAGLPGPVAELGLGTVLAAAERKVLAALPESLRERAERTRQRFHLDAPGWFRTAEELPWLSAVAAAAWDDRRIRIHYRRDGGEASERLVDPLGLVLKGGTWYLLARVEGAIRTYRVSRIAAVSETGERFEREAGFDLAAAWEASRAAFEAGLPRVEVLVRAAPAALPRVQGLFDERTRAATDWEGEPEPDGWRRLRLRFEMLDYAHQSLLGLGAEVEVLGPPALRERIAESARQLAARYDRPGGGDGRSASPPLADGMPALAAPGDVAP